MMLRHIKDKAHKDGQKETEQAISRPEPDHPPCAAAARAHPAATPPSPRVLADPRLVDVPLLLPPCPPPPRALPPPRVDNSPPPAPNPQSPRSPPPRSPPYGFRPPRPGPAPNRRLPWTRGRPAASVARTAILGFRAGAPQFAGSAPRVLASPRAGPDRWRSRLAAALSTAVCRKEYYSF
ncbi:hypothetical protein ZWY2020_016520 [Hordeum vulgare]|nr:hypothetical protein ZWY2020_016520 [Hordeum vulgare]